jgi:hypothetical protein
LGVVAVCVVVVVGVRKPAARYFLVGWLERQGVPAEAEVTGLSLTRFRGSLRAGPPGRPDVDAPVIDVRYGLTGPWTGQPLGVLVTSVLVERPVLRAAIRDGALSMGSLDPVVQAFLRRPVQPDVAMPTVEFRGGKLFLATDYGPVTLTGDGRLEDGKLMALAGRSDPAVLSGPAFAAQLGAGALTLSTSAGKTHVAFALPITKVETKTAAPFSADAGVVTLALDGPYPDLIKKRGDGQVTGSLKAQARRIAFGGQALTDAAFDAGFNGQVTGWINDLAVRGAGTANLTAKDLAGPARVTGLALAATADQVAWTRTNGDALSAQLGLVGRADQLAAADLTLTRTSATLRGPVSMGRDGLQGALSGALLAEGSYGGLGPATRADAAPVVALKRAAAGFVIVAPGVKISLGSAGPRLDLPQPIRVTARSGATASLVSAGAGYRLKVAGGGLPTVDAQARTVAFTTAGARLSGEIAAKGDFGPVQGGAVDLAGTLEAGTSGTRFIAVRCVVLAAHKLEFGANSFTSLKGQACPAGGPMFAMTPSGWRASAALRGVSGQAPGFQVAATDASANLTASGRGDAMAATISNIAARIADRSPQTRFHPLQIEGRASLANGAVLADLAARSGAFSLGRAQVRHDLAAGAGSATIDTGELVFAPGGLQPIALSPMAAAIGSPATGRARIQGGFAWTAKGMTSSGEVDIPGLDFVSPAGAVSGLAGRIVFTSLAPLVTAPGQSLKIDKVEGVAPLSDIAADFVIEGETLKLGALKASLGGGQVRLEDVEVPLTPAAQIRGVLDLDGVQLHDIVEASPFGDKVDLTARVSGRIPFETEDGHVRVREGAFRAVEPGRLSIDRAALTGVSAEGAQALATAPAPSLSTPVADFAYQAMENLAFDQLDATLNSLPEGRLGILFHLRGRHDPPQKQSIRLSLADIIARKFMDKPLPLPSGTQVNLTLDTTLNLDDLLRDFDEYQKLRHSSDVQP